MKSWAVFGVLLFAISGLMIPQFTYAQSGTAEEAVKEAVESTKNAVKEVQKEAVKAGAQPGDISEEKSATKAAEEAVKKAMEEAIEEALQQQEIRPQPCDIPEDTAKDAAKAGVEGTAEEAAKEAVESAKNAVKEVQKEAVKAGAQPGDISEEKSATKAAEEAVKKAIEEAIEEAVKKAIEEAVQQQDIRRQPCDISEADATQEQVDSQQQEIKPELSDIVIPEWIRQMVKFYADGDISDQEFVAAIEHLIKLGVIKSPRLSIVDQDEEHMQQVMGVQKEVIVPTWIQTNARWYADGAISGSEFVGGIEYMVEEEIISSPKIKVQPKPEKQIDPPSLQLDSGAADIAPELLKHLYAFNKWNELTATWLLETKKAEADILNDLVDQAWDEYSKNKDIELMNQAVTLEKDSKLSKDQALALVKTLKEIKKVEDGIKNLAKKNNVPVLDLEKAGNQPQQKINDEVKTLKNAKEVGDGYHEAKKAKNQAKRVFDSVVDDLEGLKSKPKTESDSIDELEDGTKLQPVTLGIQDFAGGKREVTFYIENSLTNDMLTILSLVLGAFPVVISDGDEITQGLKKTVNDLDDMLSLDQYLDLISNPPPPGTAPGDIEIDIKPADAEPKSTETKTDTEVKTPAESRIITDYYGEPYVPNYTTKEIDGINITRGIGTGEIGVGLFQGFVIDGQLIVQIPDDVSIIQRMLTFWTADVILDITNDGKIPIVVKNKATWYVMKDPRNPDRIFTYFFWDIESPLGYRETGGFSFSGDGYLKDDDVKIRELEDGSTTIDYWDDVRYVISHGGIITIEVPQIQLLHGINITKYPHGGVYIEQTTGDFKWWLDGGIRHDGKLWFESGVGAWLENAHPDVIKTLTDNGKIPLFVGGKEIKYTPGDTSADSSSPSGGYSGADIGDPGTGSSEDDYDFEEAVFVPSYLIGGQYYPVYQFIQADPDVCDYYHFHSATETALSIQLISILDPNPGGCGFGTTAMQPDYPVMFASEVLEWESITGIDIPDY